MERASNYWVHLLDVFLGESPKPSPLQIPIIVSLCYFATAIVSARILRALCNQWCPDRLKEYAADFVTALELCFCSLENGNIKQHYGQLAYIIDLSLLSLWFSLTIGNSTGNPCGIVIKYMKGELPLSKTCLRILVQTCGGLLSFRCARWFWWVGFHEMHAQRYANPHCLSDLTITSPVGFGIEFAATVFESWLRLNLFTHFLAAEMMTKIFSSSLLTAAGVHLTGMYLNPVNASNQTFGCHGTSIIDHLFVYWLAPLSAAALTVVFQQKMITFRKDFHLEFSNGHSSIQNGVQFESPIPATQNLDKPEFQCYGKAVDNSGGNVSTNCHSPNNDHNVVAKSTNDLRSRKK